MSVRTIVAVACAAAFAVFASSGTANAQSTVSGYSLSAYTSAVGGYQDAFTLEVTATYAVPQQYAPCTYVLAARTDGTIYYAVLPGNSTEYKARWYQWDANQVFASYCAPRTSVPTTSVFKLFTGEDPSFFAGANFFIGAGVSLNNVIATSNYRLVYTMPTTFRQRPATTQVVTAPVVPVAPAQLYSTNGVPITRTGYAGQFAYGYGQPYEIQTSCSALRSPNGWYLSTASLPAPDSWVSPVTLVGHDSFVCQARNALYLLQQRAPELYAYTVNNLRNVTVSMNDSAVMGMNPVRRTLNFRDNNDITFNTVTSLAAVFVHEATHAAIYSRGGLYYGTAAETECMQFQKLALVKIGAPQTEINALSTVLPNFFDLNGNGVYDVGDETLRYW